MALAPARVSCEAAGASWLRREGTVHTSSVADTAVTAQAPPVAPPPPHATPTAEDATDAKPEPEIVSAPPPASDTVEGERLPTLSAAPVTVGSADAGPPVAVAAPLSACISETVCTPDIGGGTSHAREAASPLEGTQADEPTSTALAEYGVAKPPPLSESVHDEALVALTATLASTGVAAAW